MTVIHVVFVMMLSADAAAYRTKSRLSCRKRLLRSVISAGECRYISGSFLSHNV
jgi:hypothetical protein